MVLYSLVVHDHNWTPKTMHVSPNLHKGDLQGSILFTTWGVLCFLCKNHVCLLCWLLVVCVCTQVVAVDQVTDGLRATAHLNITVLDYNDNTPQFPAIPDPLQIPEGDYSEESPGELLTIVPTDDDLGPNGEVTVSLVSPHPLFTFREVRPAERIVQVFLVLCQLLGLWDHVLCCRMGRCWLSALWIGRTGTLMTWSWRPQTKAAHRGR